MSLAGRSSIQKTVSLVSGSASAMPGIGSRTGRPPVAITARRKLRRAPPTSMVSGLMNRPDPRKMSTPRSRNRWTLSIGLRSARSRRMRRIAAAKLPFPSARGAPNVSDARFTWDQARAALMIPFEGTHPTCRLIWIGCRRDQAAGSRAEDDEVVAILRLRVDVSRRMDVAEMPEVVVVERLDQLFRLHRFTPDIDSSSIRTGSGTGPHDPGAPGGEAG